MSDLKTAYVTIGNSDNRLAQHEWSAFCSLVERLIRDFAVQVYFMGYALPNSQYQNACYSFTTTDDVLVLIRDSLKGLARQFDQESIALAVVDRAEMVEP